jgi:hypothetical protein
MNVEINLPDKPFNIQVVTKPYQLEHLHLVQVELMPALSTTQPFLPELPHLIRLQPPQGIPMFVEVPYRNLNKHHNYRKQLRMDRNLHI